MREENALDTASPGTGPIRTRTRVIVVLPAYNEEANIGNLLDRIDESMSEENLPYSVIVVDDGSRDRTLEVLHEYESHIPLQIHEHKKNQGLGPTIRDGLFVASQIAEPRDIIVTMDADETHTPGLILRMVRMIREGHDVVIASRYRTGARVYGLSLMRRFVSYAASWLFRIVFPTQGVRDFTCGYRAYRAATIKSAISRYGEQFITAEGFQCMVDILLKLRNMDIIFGEVPMILRYDLKGGESKMNMSRTATNTLKLMMRRRFGL
jgi:dolichol-phosphate mannosyltransferase